MWWQAVVVCAGVVTITADQPWRIVNIDQGPVKGYRAPEGHFVFYGIPYATTPKGPNKFKPPLPAPVWTEPFEAVHKFVICPQDIRPGDTIGVVLNPQEDCLITNVYVPDTEESNLPVLVHFHGGAYQYGYGNKDTAVNQLSSKKVIIVNFNYRVGAHGFLCLGTPDVPGNAGMKDQIALLRWVQRNIASFGGNPNDVTINGWSAGASSVDLVMISKLSKGLFHKVIVESGSNADPFSIQVDPIANAKMIAKRLNFDDVDNLYALEDFYKYLPFELLYSQDVGNQPDSSVVFAPCVERDLGQEIFLHDISVNILKSGDYPKVPMLYGIAEMEGLYRIDNFQNWKTMMNDNFTTFLPEDLTFESEEEREFITNKIKHFYFGDEPVSDESALKFVQYFTDVMFGHGVSKAVKLQVEAGNNQIYLYEYAYTDGKEKSTPSNPIGATHCAQTAAVMDSNNEDQLTDTYKSVKAFMRDLWLNFITTGKPVPEGSPYPAWPPVGRKGTPYMYINSDLTLKPHFLQERAIFWGEIYKKYYRTPSPPIRH